jgi:hypothetical protein
LGAAVKLSVAQVQEAGLEQEQADLLARGTVARKLNPDPGAPEINQEDLNEAVSGASLTTRADIFILARNQRQKTDKAALERTIPVFRALLAAETDEKFHRTSGQLGYALKDKEPPDYHGAVDMLTQAIEVRDELNERGFLLYELNRAVALIHQYGPDAPLEIRAKIEADLKACTVSSFLTKAIEKDEEGIIKKFRDAAPGSS